MFLSAINFGSAASSVAEMQATGAIYDSQAALINNSRSQESLLRNPSKDVFEKDKKLALERAKLQTELKIQEANKKALEEKRKKEAAKK